MLKDYLDTYDRKGDASISVPAYHSINGILDFIDINLDGFRDYYFTSDKSEKENYVTQQLVNYFNSALNDVDDGFNPNRFSFGKNPSQASSAKEADIGVVILNKSIASTTIIEFEAKRLSHSSNNSEYVYGERGGIERFKREQHGTHLAVCGMFGYIQTKTVVHWLGKINEWISDLAVNNKDYTINWKPQPEKLVKVSSTLIDKYESLNMRREKMAIKLYHYFINLVP